MIKKLQYNLLCSDDPVALTVEVNKLLAQGWDTHGSPFYGAERFCQGMVLRAPMTERRFARKARQDDMMEED